MPEKKIREARLAHGYASYPGKVEYGCLHATLIGGEMDRVFIEDEEEARLDVLDMREKGAKAELVSRVVPNWTTIPTTLPELYETRADYRARLAQEKKEREAKERAARAADDEELSWKEL